MLILTLAKHMDAQKIKEQVKNQLTEYLNSHKHRKTPERFAILDHIYSTKGHFDVESLYQSMNTLNFRVSRATLYNTIELLLDCDLLVKHQFGENISQYERAIGNENHDHLICTSCGKVKEYKNGNLFTQAQQKKVTKFKVSYYSMYIYGTCSKCLKEKQQAEKKNKSNKNQINSEKKK